MDVSETNLRRFSHSLVDQYLRCPRKAEFQYVEQVPSAKSAALVKGSACDGAWNHALRAKLEDGEIIPLETLLEVTEAEFRGVVREEGGKGEVDWGESDARAELDSALRLTKQWHLGLFPDIEPTAVQVELHRPLPSGRDFVGFLDWEGSIDGSGPVIGDNKTASRRMPTADAEKALQPSAYAYLKCEPIVFFFARAIDTGKSQSSEFVRTERTVADVRWYEDLIQKVEQQWEAGVFIPNPTNTLCSLKHCPYYERCMPNRTVHGGAG